MAVDIDDKKLDGKGLSDLWGIIKQYVAQHGSGVVPATEDTLGGIMVGSTLSITNAGVLNLPTLVTASTFRSVSVDAYGRVVGGTNPTTLAAYGITDAKIENGVITLGGNTITPITSLSGYATQSWVQQQGYTTNIGTVTQVKIGSTEYNPTSGVVSLPAYPTSLPASDVYSWAKASSKPSYSWSEIGSRPTALSQFTNDSGFITSSGSCNYANSASNDGNGNNIVSTYVPKMPTGHFYNYIGSNYRSSWYKVTLPFQGTSSTSNRWMMVSMELVLKGNFGGGSDGKIFLRYYIYYPANNTVGSPYDVYGVAIGSRLGGVRVAYQKNNLGIFYVYIPESYNSFAIQNLSANDSAPAFDFRNTTIEGVSAPSDSSITDISISKLYTTDGSNLYRNGNQLIDTSMIQSVQRGTMYHTVANGSHLYYLPMSVDNARKCVFNYIMHNAYQYQSGCYSCHAGNGLADTMGVKYVTDDTYNGTRITNSWLVTTGGFDAGNVYYNYVLIA